MTYCDSTYYLETYLGDVVPQGKLDTWLLLASNKIRESILNRDVTPYEDIVKQCTCRIAEALYLQDKKRNELITDGAITSESVGDYSRTFADATTSSRRASNDIVVYDILNSYLGCTGLLYRGFDV